MNRLFLSVVCAAAALAAFATAGNCGASSFAEILAAEPSVRANGMGNAYTAANNDVFGAYYNPAQTIDAERISFVYQRGYADDNTEGIGIALPLGNFKLGLSTLYYDAGSMNLYNTNGFIASVNAERDYVGLVSLAYKTGNLSLGVNGKYVSERLFEAVSGSGFTGALGARLELPDFTLGVAAQNISGGLQLGSQTESFRRTLRAGAYRTFDFDTLSLSAAFDVVRTDDEKSYERFGGEVFILKTIALRGGYEFGGVSGQSGGMSFGFGAKLGTLTVDYALVPNSDLGSTHKAGVTMDF